MFVLFYIIFFSLGSKRFLTISKKKPRERKIKDNGTPLSLSNQSIDLINELLQKSPLTDEEKNLNTLTHNLNNQNKDTRLPFTYTITSNNGNRKTVIGVPPAPKGNIFKSIRENLPIFPYRQEILDTVDKNQVIVISGETGKSMQTTCF